MCLNSDFEKNDTSPVHVSSLLRPSLPKSILCTFVHVYT